MPDPNSDLQSKICRAVKAMLVSEGAGSAIDTFIELSSDPRPLPNTTISTGGGDELVKYSGIWKFQNVRVEMRDNATVQPTEINPVAAIVAATERYNRIRTALSRLGNSGEFTYTPALLTAAGRALAVSDGSEEGDQRAEDNADMAYFTITWWNITGLSAPQSNSEATCFESELQFECHACNGNV
jgi:hypothetical protein